MLALLVLLSHLSTPLPSCPAARLRFRDPMPGGVLGGYSGDTGLDIGGSRLPVYAIAAGTLDYAGMGPHALGRPARYGVLRAHHALACAHSLARSTRSPTSTMRACPASSSRSPSTPASDRRHVAAGERLGTSGIANARGTCTSASCSMAASSRTTGTTSCGRTRSAPRSAATRTASVCGADPYGTWKVSGWLRSVPISWVMSRSSPGARVGDRLPAPAVADDRPGHGLVAGGRALVPTMTMIALGSAPPQGTESLTWSASGPGPAGGILRRRQRQRRARAGDASVPRMPTARIRRTMVQPA